MKKTTRNRIVSAVMAVMLTVMSIVPSDLLGVTQAKAAEVPDSEIVEVLVKDSSDPNKVQVTDKSTLLVGDGILLETEPATFKGATLDETIANYDKHYALGIASQFCIFLLEDFTPMQSDAEGRVAVGRDINVKVPSGWGGYAVGKGDYVTNETLDKALGKIESPGYAHIIMGGKINYNNILSESYSGTNTRKLVINDDLSNVDSHLTEYLPENALGKIDKTQTYVAKLIEFDREFEKLIDKSAEWAVQTPDGTAELDQNGHFVFTYSGNADDEKEYVYFTITETDWEKFQKAKYIDFKNIPKLPTALYGDDGRVLMDYDYNSSTKKLEESHWYNSFIIINVLGDGGDDGKHIAQYGNGEKYTTINEQPISRSDGNTQSYWNNHIGTSSILYNFPQATKVVLGNNFQGTIFAPLADVTDEWYLHNKSTVDDTNGAFNRNQDVDKNNRGHLSGSLIAKSFEGGTEFGYRPFAGLAVAESTYAVEDSKLDPAKNFVSGATLRLEKLVKDDNGTFKVGDVTYRTEAVAGYDEFVSDGKTHLIENLKPGYYILSEIKAPTGYSKTNEKIYFEISNGDIVYTSIQVDGVLEKPVIYTVVDDEDADETNHTIRRSQTETGEFIPVTPLSNDHVVKSFSWCNGIGQVTNQYMLEIEEIKIYHYPGTTDTITYQPGSYPVVAIGDGGWPSNGFTNFTFNNKTNVEKITVSLRYKNAPNGIKQDATVILQGGIVGEGDHQPSVILSNVSSTNFKTYTIFGEADPTEYYKLDDNSEVVRNHNKIEGESIPLTTITSNLKGNITVYSDSSFTKVEDDETTEDVNEKNYSEYTSNPLDIENNIYNIDGINYVFKKNASNVYDVYTYDDQETEITLSDVEVKAVDGGYVVLYKNAVVDPMQILTRVYDGEFGFSLENRKYITISKTDVNGSLIPATNGATFKITATADLSAAGIKIGTDYDTATDVTLIDDNKAFNVRNLGEAVIHNLPDGDYILTEEEAPTVGDYTKLKGTISFTIENGVLTSVTCTSSDDSGKVNFANNKISVANAEDDNFTITKKWVDNNNERGARPGKVTLTITGKLTDDGAPADKDINYEVELAIGDADDIDSNIWNKTIYTSSEVKYGDTYKNATTGEITFPMYYYETVENEVKEYKYTYTVSEKNENIPELYISTKEGDYTVVNTFTDEIGSVTVDKSWSDFDYTGFGNHPEITFTLTALEGTSNEINKTIKLENGVLTGTFSDLPLYTYSIDIDGNLLRTPIVYTLKETAVAGYGTTITADGSTIESNTIEFTLVNVTNNTYPSIGTKTVAFTNTYTGISFQLTKEWKNDDKKYNDGVRIDELNLEIVGTANGKEVVRKPVTLNDNGTDTWIASISDLPTVYYENGTAYPITYKVEEPNPPEGYTPDGGDTDTDGTFKVSNDFVEEKGNLKVTKIWEDFDYTGFGNHPEIKFTLESPYTDPMTVTLENGKTVADFNNLPLYAYSRTVSGTLVRIPIEYTLTEITLDGYTSAITGSTWKFTLVDVSTGYPSTASKNVDVTNTYKSTALTVTKNWVVDSKWTDEEAKLRPDSIIFTVKGTVEGKSEPVYTTTITLPDGNTWSKTLSELPEYYYDNGMAKKITYTVTEDKVPAYYESELDTKSSANNFIFNNTYKQDTTSVSVKKVWVDKLDSHKEIAVKVTVKSSTNATVFDEEVKLNDNNGWTWSMSGLPKYSYVKGSDAVTEVTYTVTVDEVNVPNDYKVTYDGNGTKANVVVTNTYVAPTITPTATPTAEATATPTAEATATPTVEATATPTAEATATPTAEATATPTAEATATPTAEATATPTAEATATPTAEATATPTAEATATPTAEATATPTAEATATPTPEVTEAPTDTPTPEITGGEAEATSTPTPEITGGAEATATPTVTPYEPSLGDGTNGANDEMLGGNVSSGTSSGDDAPKTGDSIDGMFLISLIALATFTVVAVKKKEEEQ